MRSFISAILSLICEFGEMVNERCTRYNDRLYECDWYLCPVEVQRMFLTFMGYSQQSVALGTFLNIKCTREMLKKVKIFICCSI